MTEQPLFHSFQEYIHNNHLIERGEKILVSVSGGIDSMALLDLSAKLKTRLKIEIAVAHFNHQLRGKESDEDEAFVRSASKEYGFDCYVENADTNRIAENEKLSIQEAARNLRYAFFTKLRRSIGFQKIATAHNADDNAETIILNILRGSGIHGLTGIPVFKKDTLIIRPLLFAQRETIREYVESNQIKFREDSSNLKSDYTRNFLRNELLPLIRDNINPNFTKAIGRTSEIFNQLEEYIQKEIETVLKQIIILRTDNEMGIDLVVFQNQPTFIQEHLLLFLAKEFTSSEIEFNTIKSMLSISQAETGSYCSLPKEKIFYRDRKRLIFTRTSHFAPFSYSIKLDKKYNFDTFIFESSTAASPEITNDPNIEYIDGAKLGDDIIIRSWVEGDRFIPLGMKEEKKLSDFFIDRKIPLFKKHSIPILLSDDKIVWVCGIRLDDRFKISDQTKHYIRLYYSPKP